MKVCVFHEARLVEAKNNEQLIPFYDSEKNQIIPSNGIEILNAKRTAKREKINLNNYHLVYVLSADGAPSICCISQLSVQRE